MIDDVDRTDERDAGRPRSGRVAVVGGVSAKLAASELSPADVCESRFCRSRM